MKKRFLTAAFLAGMTAVLAACGSFSGAVKNSAAYEAAADTAGMYDGGMYSYDKEAPMAASVTEEVAVENEYGDMAVAGEGSAEALPDALAGRKLIKTVNMNVETEQFDALVPHLEKRIAALGGYIEDMSSYNRMDDYAKDYIGKKYLRYISMTVRMPRQHLDAFLEEVDGQSNIVSRWESVTDVTLQYVDLESHKKALATEQDRLLELMEQAETVEDLITIEGRLSEVRYQLESMESQLRTYDNQIDYSTVNLSIDEVEQYTPTGGTTTGERIRLGFKESVRGVGRGIGNAAIWVVVNLPYLAVWALVIVMAGLVVRVVSRAAAKRRAKRAASRAKANPYQAQGAEQVPYQMQNRNPGPSSQPEAVGAGQAQSQSPDPAEDSDSAGMPEKTAAQDHNPDQQ